MPFSAAYAPVQKERRQIYICRQLFCLTCPVVVEAVVEIYNHNLFNAFIVGKYF